MLLPSIQKWDEHLLYIHKVRQHVGYVVSQMAHYIKRFELQLLVRACLYNANNWISKGCIITGNTPRCRLIII